MILGSRQMKFGCANVPPIEYESNPNVKGYETIVEVFTEALMERQSYYYRNRKEFKGEAYKEIIADERKRYKDYLSRTIDFLKKIGALRKARKIKNIKLWKDLIEMEPFYEGIAVQLKSTLTKKHYPNAYENMSKGATYSYQPLTDMGEVVVYVMEYFTKEELLNDADKVLRGDFVKKWVKDYIKYVKEHKKKLEEEEKDREEYRKKERKEMDKMMEDMEKNRECEIE